MPSLRARLSVLLCLYVAQGLPTGIYNQALPAILRTHGVSLAAISLTSLLAAPWALKVFWAPWVDRWYWPKVGRSRSWILPLQVLCIGVILLIAGFDPSRLGSPAGLSAFFLLMFLLNLMAATQDIATDSLAVRTLLPGERGAGNSVQVAGYRVGLILGGGLLLYLLGVWSWPQAFLLVAGLLVLLTLPMAFFREPAGPAAAEPPRVSYRAVFSAFLQMPGMRHWLPVLVTYKIAEGFGSAMVKPMLVDMGFDLRQLGLQITILGSAGTVLGAVLGGLLMNRMGRMQALLVFGSLQAVGLGGYGLLSAGWLPCSPASPEWAYLWNAVEHLAAGLATVALLTVVMDHARHDHAGSDFTLQVSLLAVTGGLAHMGAGIVAQSFGYTAYYVLAMGLGLVLLWPVVRWGRAVTPLTRV